MTRPLDVLLVAAVEGGSGETITTMHMADDLTSRGHTVRFLASEFAASFLEPQFGTSVQTLSSGDRDANVQLWADSVAGGPDAVVFSDFSLFSFPSGTSPLAQAPGWLDLARSVDTTLVTLDHFGFSQREILLFPGPPHLGIQTLRIPAIPEDMNIMLPCPMHEPADVEGRIGRPFRYWRFPLGVDEETRRSTRARYLQHEDGLLVFHSVPRWAVKAADALGIGGFYRHLPVFLDHYLSGTNRPVTLVSVNDGQLLRAPGDGTLEIMNLPPIPSAEFEALLFSADLVMTENKVSISLGKAICAGQVSAVLRNSKGLLDVLSGLDGDLRQAVLAMERSKAGTVFPFEVFPTGMTGDLDEIVLYRDNRLTEGFAELEVFGGDVTRGQVGDLLEDEPTRAALTARQRAYADAVANLPSASVVLERIVEEHRAGS